MNKREFDYIMQNGESYLVEFKERVNSSLAREMTVFANASGGKIFLGVTDGGKSVGIDITNKFRSRIQDMANNCQPSVSVVLKKYHNILIIDIPEGKDKPYQCSEGFFIRMGSNAQKMDRDRIVEFLQAEGKVRFEEQVHKRFSFKTDYSPAKLSGYLKLAGITQNLDDPSILSNLGLQRKLTIH
jgi:ATP-dependent DNA helicase RecG